MGKHRNACYVREDVLSCFTVFVRIQGKNELMNPSLYYICGRFLERSVAAGLCRKSCSN